MNVNPKTLVQSMAIAVLLAVGVATTVSSCGDGSSRSVTPPSNLLFIHADNAFDVSSALITAIDISFDISELTGGDIPGQFAVGSTRLEKLLWNDGLAMKASAAIAPIAVDCPGGGTVTVTTTLADPNTLTVGDQITADFDNCDEGDGYVLDGQMNLTVAAIQGDIMTDVFLLGLDLAMIDMAITEGAETVVVDASITLTLDTLGFPVIVETLEGSELSLASGSETVSFTNFEHVFQVDIGAVPETIVVTVGGRMDSAQLGGAIDYATTAALQAFGDDYPYTGGILISGDNSSVRIVITDSNSVRLEIDTNADGVIDHYIDTTFAALIGDPPIINSLTALAVAQEVTHASVVFGLEASSPGSFFALTGPFGQVKQLAVSGNFGPLELACGDMGTAVVSGFVANAETFTANDSLSGVLTDCLGAWTGQVDIIVSSFTEESTEMPAMTPPFQVVGTMTLTNLEYVGPDVTYVGSGTLETDFDYQQYFGPIVVNGSASTFAVEHGDVVQTLSDASVSLWGSIDGASGSYAGRLASDRLEGEYSFESISGYAWFPWGNQSTGSPYSGELLITADDGSTVRIVVIDENSIRLDVDYEGDSLVDTTIATTWAELLQ